MGPLPGAILRTTRTDAGSVNATASYGVGPIMNATSRNPHVARHRLGGVRRIAIFQLNAISRI